MKNETGKNLCIRLARDKANIVAKSYPNNIIIGSDQVANFKDKNLGKPHTYENAFKTIMKFSGKNVFFNTGVVIISQNKGIDLSYIDQTIIAFKPFKDTDLIQYLDSQDDFRTTAAFIDPVTMKVSNGKLVTEKKKWFIFDYSSSSIIENPSSSFTANLEIFLF